MTTSQTAAAQSDTRLSLRAAAARLSMSAFGLQKILARTGNLLRDDGHWFANESVIAEIKQARETLGLKSRSANVDESPQQR